MDDTPTPSDSGAEPETFETNPLADTAVPENTPQTITTGLIKTDNAALNKEPSMRFAKRCHQGAVRDRNEDSSFIFVSETGGDHIIQPFGLYIVADGMGGHQHGDEASKIASRIAGQRVLSDIYLPMLRDEGRPSAPIQEVLVQAVQAANRAVYESDPESDRGTTLTAALVLGRRLYVAHVGDSRLYLHTNDKLETITHDHSLVQQLQDVGHEPDEATMFRYGHVLLRAVGQDEELEVDTYTRSLPRAGKLLLCSDGLIGRGLVTEPEIEEILSAKTSLQSMADTLFERAMDAGGYDNITAVVVSFDL